MSLMAPDLSRLFPSNFNSFAENTRNSPFLHPTAMSSPSRLKATERAALTVSLPTNDYKGKIIASKGHIIAPKVTSCHKKVTPNYQKVTSNYQKVISNYQKVTS